MKRLSIYSWLFACFFLITGCSTQIISPYDAGTLQQMEVIDSNIDRFYLTLGYMPKQERTYDKFASKYIDIDVKIRALERRQTLRNSNQETLKQTQILSSLWQQDMQSHRDKNTVSDFIIKRHMSQYQRIMATLMKGELAKKI